MRNIRYAGFHAIKTNFDEHAPSQKSLTLIKGWYTSVWWHKNFTNQSKRKKRLLEHQPHPNLAVNWIT